MQVCTRIDECIDVRPEVTWNVAERGAQSAEPARSGAMGEAGADGLGGRGRGDLVRPRG